MIEGVLRLLGGFVWQPANGEPGAKLGTRKARALFAYLALNRGRKVPRAKLADLLWGRSGERQAANSVNQALYSLKKELGDAGGSIEADNEHAWIAAEAVSTDVAELEAAVDETDPDRLREALRLYGGPLLQGLDLPEEGFSDWLATERARLEDLAVTIGNRLVSDHAVPSDNRSLGDARQLLQIDPYNESAQMLLMRHHALEGRGRLALRHYEEFAKRLEHDLSVPPSTGILGLVEQIKAGEFDKPDTGATRTVPQETSFAKGSPARRWLMLAAGAACLVAAVVATVMVYSYLSGGRGVPPEGNRRIAVFPFQAESGVDESLARGLADDVTTELTALADLSIIARESVNRIASDSGRSPEELGAAYLIRGRLRRSDAELVLNIWLVDSGRGEQVWAARYTGSSDELPSFQEQIVAGIRGGLLQTLGMPAPAARTESGTANPVAYEAYLKGLTAFYRGTPATQADAEAAFRRALDLDPQFAKARAGLARVYFRATFGGQAYAEALDVNWIAAFLNMKRELATLPESSRPEEEIVRAKLALHRRDHEAAIDHARAAVQVSGGSAEAVEILAEALIYAGQTDLGEDYARQALTLNPATAERPTFLFALAAFARGDAEAARDLARQALEYSPYPTVNVLGLLAAASAAAGGDAAAREYLSRYVAEQENRPRNQWRVLEREFSNPRRTTWLRPTLAQAVYEYPFADGSVLERLAEGFTRAGIAGSTLGYFPTSRDWRLSGAELKELVLGQTIRGRGIMDLDRRWEQTRDASGALVQEGAMGTMLLARRGRSRIEGDQLCDSWEYQSVGVESCATVFRLHRGMPAPVRGTHLVTTEFGPFAITQADE